MIKGFDCSHNNPVNQGTCSTDFKFCFLKGAQGATFHDPAFQTQWKAAKSAGRLVGVYDFWVAQVDPQMQADNFLNRGVDWSESGVLPPVIDIENQVGATPALSGQMDKYILNNKEKCRDNALNLLEIVASSTGRTPIIYCSPNFLQEYLGDSEPFGKYGLWIAGIQPEVPRLPKGFTDWLFWQYTWKGTSAGAETGGQLDLNWFNGTQEELNKLANITT